MQVLRLQSPEAESAMLLAQRARPPGITGPRNETEPRSMRDLRVTATPLAAPDF